jgi:hypothetical protein
MVNMSAATEFTPVHGSPSSDRRTSLQPRQCRTNDIRTWKTQGVALQTQATGSMLRIAREWLSKTLENVVAVMSDG